MNSLNERPGMKPPHPLPKLAGGGGGGGGKKNNLKTARKTHVTTGLILQSSM